MIRADYAIARCRRDLAVSSALKGIMLGAAVLLMIMGMGLKLGSPVILAGIGGLWVFWMMLNYRSMKASRMAALSPALIASGDFERAEQQIQEAIESFSLFRTVKLMSLHHLAVLRHAQRRWPEAAMVSQAVLSERVGALAGLSTRCRLILADSLLEMGDLYGAHGTITWLYQDRLGLGEALTLLALQLDYQSRIGAWNEMTAGIDKKVEMSELMPPASAARAQAFLALAAKCAGNEKWATWLRKRVELLAEPAELVAERPVLAAIWEGSAAKEAVADEVLIEAEREPPAGAP